MSDLSATTAIGSFSDRRHAHLAVEDLVAAGFPLEDIGFVTPEGEPIIEAPLPPSRGNKLEAGAATGAAIGSVVGGIVGAALAPSFIADDDLGLMGLLVGAVSGVVAGLATGGLLGALIGLRIPDYQAKKNERHLHDGQTIVTVKAGNRYDEALAILEKANALPELSDANPRGRLSTMGNSEPSPGTGGVFPGGT